jgi:hypothetical protein
MERAENVTLDQVDDPLTREIIGAAIEVHRRLGPGLLNTPYLRDGIKRMIL